MKKSCIMERDKKKTPKKKFEYKNSYLTFPSLFGSNKSNVRPTLDEHQNDRNEFFENCMMARYPVSGVKRDEDLYFAHQSKMDEPKIPCEFCDKLFPASEVVLHTAGCNPEEVSLPKPVSTVRQKGNETSSRQLKRFYDSTMTSEPFFPAGRGTSIPSTKYEITYKRLEKSISGQYLENVVKPKVAKCSYCKTTLNDNILLFHEKECVYQPTKCPDCSATILLKDADSHFCKPAKKNNKVSEIDLLSKNFKDLFTDENCWDTVLQVGSKEFKAHRTILIARSSVFSAMFQHDTSEKQTGLIKVPDCDPDTFKEFLEYLYCGKLENISSDCALHLYTISDKYNVQELKSFCAKYLMQNITAENICDVAILADTYDETELFSAVQEFFNKNFKEIVMISVWEDLFKKNFRLANKLLIGKAKVE